MKKIFKAFVIPSAIMFLYSCGVTLDETEISEMVFSHGKGGGMIAGASIGDNWEKIKSKCDERWEVREETTEQNDKIIQFRKDWDIAHDYIYIDFELDEQKNINKIKLKLQGTGAKNGLTVRTFTDKVIDYFNTIPRIELTDNNTWRYSSENGTALKIRYDYRKREEEKEHTLSVHIEKSE